MWLITGSEQAPLLDTGIQKNLAIFLWQYTALSRRAIKANVICRWQVQAQKQPGMWMYFGFDTTYRNIRVSHKAWGDMLMLESLKGTFWL